MNQDAFELLQAANPLPEDPPPLPIAPLLERVEDLPSQPPGFGRRPKSRSRMRFSLTAVGAGVAVAGVAALALTASTVVSPTSDLGKTVVAPEHETALANQMTPDEYQDFKESSNSVVTLEQISR